MRGWFPGDGTPFSGRAAPAPVTPATAPTSHWFGSGRGHVGSTVYVGTPAFDCAMTAIRFDVPNRPAAMASAAETHRKEVLFTSPPNRRRARKDAAGRHIMDDCAAPGLVAGSSHGLFRRVCHLDNGQEHAAVPVIPGESLEREGDAEAPAIAGEGFQRKWNGRTAWDLFDTMAGTMPVGGARTLSPQEYADLLACLFELNSIPPAHGNCRQRAVSWS